MHRDALYTQSSSELFEELCCGPRDVNPETLEQTVTLAVELAREGREGRKVGTIFVVGDTEAVLLRSRPMILDPLHGHDEDTKDVADANVRETLKELAQLDGGFVVRDDGVVVSAARYFDAPTDDLELPLGLGSRHMAAAAITVATKAVAVVVSESAVVRLFDDGDLIAEILPELWMLSRYSSHVDAPHVTRTEDQVTVVSKAE
jgi:DNA integrity scanning protein DisA with diadenylate cyclase activity